MICLFHRDVENNSKIFTENEKWKAEVILERPNFFLVKPIEFDIDYIPGQVQKYGETKKYRSNK